jgi:large subunit ribosomal protein L6
MSRVGKNPVEVPSGVEVTINGSLVAAKGKLGRLEYKASDDVTVSLEDGKVWVRPVNQSKRARAMWGTARSRVQNLVSGVNEGFSKQLEINGVGYRVGSAIARCSKIAPSSCSSATAMT